MLEQFSDSPQLDCVGYDNCDMRTNGEYLVLSHYIKSNTIVFDVGANIGEWSASVLKQIPNVHIYAFEPIPSIFDTLEQTLVSDAVQFFNIAFSNAQGIQKFHYFTHHSALSTFFNRPQVLAYAGKTSQLLDVATDTLDNFCTEHGIESIDFLKIDTEGAEVAILQGAMQLLRNQRIQYIQFEYGGTYYDAHTTLQEAYRLLSSCNYQIYRIVSDGLIHISQWRDALENYRYSNYLAIVME